MNKQRPTFLSYRCDECGKYPIQKYRWECNVCEDFDMCTACYEGGAHDKSHDCTQHVIQTRKVGPTTTRSSLSTAAQPTDPPKPKPKPKTKPKPKSKAKPKAKPKPKPKSKAKPKDTSSGSGALSAASVKAQQVKTLYDSLGLSRKKVGTNKLELFLALYNAALDKWPKKQSAPVVVRRHFLYITELLLNYQASVPAVGVSESGASLEETYEMGLQVVTCAHAQITMWESDQLGWFGAPVPASVPNYHELIKEPSDLGTIHMLLGKKKLLKHVPSAGLKALEALFKEYCHRMELIWKNAYEYNPDDHPVFLSAKRLSRVCIKSVLVCMRCFPSLRNTVSTEEGFLKLWSEIPDNFKFPICTEADSTGNVKRASKKGRSKQKGSRLKRKSAPAKTTAKKVAKLQHHASVGAARNSKSSSSESESALSGHESGVEVTKESGEGTSSGGSLSTMAEEVSSLDKGIKALHAKLDRWFKVVENFRLVY